MTFPRPDGRLGRAFGRPRNGGRFRRFANTCSAYGAALKFQAVLDFVPAGSPDKFRSLRSRQSGVAVPRRVLNLCLQSGADTTRHDVAIDDLVVAGWTGRDPAAVEK